MSIPPNFPEPIWAFPPEHPSRSSVQSSDEEREDGRHKIVLISPSNMYPNPLADVHVLDDVSFSVQAGETLCILGRSGWVNLFLCSRSWASSNPTRAKSWWPGRTSQILTKIRWRSVRKKVTMVFQSGALFDSLSVGENVAFPLRERGQLLEDQIQQVVNGLLDMVGVAGMADLLPSDLSTGMKRSVAIARALAAQPEAILYDEPTTMVDPLMGRLLGNLIQKFKHQLRLTSIVVTHDMRFAERLADHVLFLHEAKAYFFGTMDELKQTADPFLREFLDLDKLVLPEA